MRTPFAVGLYLLWSAILRKSSRVDQLELVSAFQTSTQHFQSTFAFFSLSLIFSNLFANQFHSSPPKKDAAVGLVPIGTVTSSDSIEWLTELMSSIRIQIDKPMTGRGHLLDFLSFPNSLKLFQPYKIRPVLIALFSCFSRRMLFCQSPFTFR